MDRKQIMMRQIAKYGIFVLMVFILYILQSTPGFFSIFGLKPVFMLPFCITLSMLDETWQAGVVYITGGLLTDLSCGRVPGTFTILLLLVCFGSIIAVKFFFKPNKQNIITFNFACMVLMLTFDFYFSFMFGGYTGKRVYYLKNVLLVSGYSSVFSLLYYYFIDYINLRFVRFDAR